MTGTRGATPHVSDVVSVMQELGAGHLEERRKRHPNVPGREAQKPYMLRDLKPKLEARMGGTVGDARIRAAVDAAIDVGLVREERTRFGNLYYLAGDARLLTTGSQQVRELPEPIKAAARAAGKSYTHTLGGDR